MTRFAKEKQVIFWEEPIIREDLKPHIVVRGINPTIVTPIVKKYCNKVLEKLLREFLKSRKWMGPFTRWYYTPMMLPFSRFMPTASIIYDCMDELSLFKNSPKNLIQYEDELLREADLVFTGGHSLYLEKQKKRQRHIFPFPSSVDRKHFEKTVLNDSKPEGQYHLSYPRVGYAGVLDERLDLELIEHIATVRPEYNFIFIGPVVKINKEDLPKLPNIHYLGQKSYDELPDYMAGWNVCIMPFALNDATRFISPTKTPEYLASGRAVVSTAVPDVVYSYSDLDCVFIGDKSNFAELIDQAMHSICLDADRKLASMSWDKTYQKMSALIRRIEQHF
jgi:UDP-galactopyranose mutase